MNYQYAFEGGSQFDGFSFGRAWTDIPVTGNPTVRHAIKFQADWTLPFGRGERFGGNMGAVRERAGRAAGASPASAASRRRVQDLGNVRLVGMSVDDLQDVYKFYRRDERRDRHRRGLDAAGGHHPQHAARVQHEQHDASTATRRAWARREGRYIAPANSADCVQVKAGDCAPRNVLLLSPWFKRFDFGVAKRFDIGGTTNVEVRFDLLNLFDNAELQRRSPNPGYRARRSSARPAPTRTRATPTIRAAASGS